MKCLSLWEPWATLIARGDKHIETRSWFTSYRGPLAIQSAKSTKLLHMWEALWYEANDGIPGCAPATPATWPHGRVIAVATLFDCVPTVPLADVLSMKERAFGDYTIGRFAWLLKDVRVLSTPIPTRGYQGLWDLDPEVAAAVNKQIYSEKKS